MMSGHWILDEQHQPVLTDLMTWALWFERTERVVAVTEIPDGSVSTVFLGLDHNFGAGAPLLFETMVFGGPHDGYCDRYATWDEAIAGHQRALELATKTGAVDPQATSTGTLTTREKLSSLETERAEASPSTRS